MYLIKLNVNKSIWYNLLCFIKMKSPKSRYLSDIQAVTDLHDGGDLLYIDFFQKPCHISAKSSKSSNTLLVLLYISRFPGKSHIPVVRARYYHFAYAKKQVDAGVCHIGTGPSCHNHRCSYLSL